MRNVLYIAVAAGLAMFSTSAIIALATAPQEAPPIEVTGVTHLAELDAPSLGHSEAELVAQLDRVIESQLREIKRQLRVTAVD